MMGGESCSSASVNDHYLKNGVSGNDMELLNLKGAQLYLVDEEESVAMQCGDFKLVLTKQLHSPLAAMVGIVKDVEWPVGEDCLVLKLGRGCYTFGLPGILYGLLLPDYTSTEALRQLEIVLIKYCTFEDHSGEIGVSESEAEDGAASYWNDVAWRVESLCLKLGGRENHVRIKTTKQQQQQQQRRKGDVAALSPRMMKRVQQARRLSAVSKLFSRALLKGAISNAKHVINTTDNVKPFRKDEAVASVDAFTKVVDAVESPRRSVLELGLMTHNGRQQEMKLNHHHHHHSHSSSSPLGSSWTLNALGLQLLIGAVAASTAINFSKPGAKPARPPLPSSTSLNPYQNGSDYRHGFRPVAPQQSHH